MHLLTLPLVKGTVARVAEHWLRVPPDGSFLLEPARSYSKAPAPRRPALPLRARSASSILPMDKAPKVRGLIRIKPAMPRANANSVGQQKRSENLPFEAEKASHIFSFSTFGILRVIRSLPGKVKRETICKHFCCFILNSLRFVCPFLLKGPHYSA